MIKWVIRLGGERGIGRNGKVGGEGEIEELRKLVE